MTDALRAILIEHTNHRGLVLAAELTLRRQLRQPAGKIRRSLQRLEEAGEIEILCPFPFLVARARSWSGGKAQPLKEAQQMKPQSSNHKKKVPVSSSKAAAAATHTEVGGAGEGGELLEEVLVALGSDADHEEFARLLEGYSPVLIRRCLDRVRATKRIRVSKAALFRSLLEKLSR